jgi:hypothetical protein
MENAKKDSEQLLKSVIESNIRTYIYDSNNKEINGIGF